MSSLLSHAAQITANQDMAKHLESLHTDATLGDGSRQWRMTCYFYAAAHHVEEQLQKHGYGPSGNHSARKKNLRHVWHASRPNAVKAYMDLETRSRETRYDGIVPTDPELSDAQRQLNEVLADLI